MFRGGAEACALDGFGRSAKSDVLRVSHDCSVHENSVQILWKEIIWAESDWWIP